MVTWGILSFMLLHQKLLFHASSQINQIYLKEESQDEILPYDLLTITEKNRRRNPSLVLPPSRLSQRSIRCSFFKAASPWRRTQWIEMHHEEQWLQFLPNELPPIFLHEPLKILLCRCRKEERQWCLMKELPASGSRKTQGSQLQTSDCNWIPLTVVQAPLPHLLLLLCYSVVLMFITTRCSYTGWGR